MHTSIGLADVDLVRWTSLSVNIGFLGGCKHCQEGEQAGLSKDCWKWADCMGLWRQVDGVSCWRQVYMDLADIDIGFDFDNYSFVY